MNNTLKKGRGKRQCPKLCSVCRSKVELLRCTVQECTQWFNCIVIVCVCACVCSTDCRDLLHSQQVHTHKSMSCFIQRHDRLSPSEPPYLCESPGKDSTHEQHQPWLLLSAESSQEPLQFPFFPPLHSLTLLPFISNAASRSITFSCDIYSLFYDEFIKSRQ